MVTRGTAGFTYLTVLFVVAFMGVGLALTGEVWHTATAREREAELLYVGHQYRKAIERYYLSGPRQYPRTLEDLLKDPRKPGTERYLRRLYPDPLTGKDEWGIVKGPDGGVMGVFSVSEEQPLKSANFLLRDREFEGTKKYADWKFVYAPSAQAAAKPGVKPEPGGPAGSTPAGSPTAPAPFGSPTTLSPFGSPTTLSPFGSPAAPSASGSPAPPPSGSPTAPIPFSSPTASGSPAPTPFGSPGAPTPFGSPTAPTTPATR
jgi:type II secretory pathway pseudopilin PulG